jgi:hypothetical protein
VNVNRIVVFAQQSVVAVRNHKICVGVAVYVSE